MKRMLRWRFRRCIASLLMFAMTVPLGEGLVARMFTPAAQAAAARQQSVVVFDFANKSNYGGEAFGTLSLGRFASRWSSRRRSIL